MGMHAKFVFHALVLNIKVYRINSEIRKNKNTKAKMGLKLLFPETEALKIQEIHLFSIFSLPGYTPYIFLHQSHIRHQIQNGYRSAYYRQSSMYR